MTARKTKKHNQEGGLDEIKELTNRVLPLLELRDKLNTRIRETGLRIRREIILDLGLVPPSPDTPVEDLLELFHRRYEKGFSEVWTLEPSYKADLEEMVKVTAEIAEIVPNLVDLEKKALTSLRTELDSIYSASLRNVAKAIRHMCLDDDEAADLAASFGRVAEIRERAEGLFNGATIGGDMRTESIRSGCNSVVRKLEPPLPEPVA